MLETDARLALIQDWLTSALRLKVRAVEPASSDASFRRYFRAFTEGATYIVMDAPADKEDVRPYLKVTALLEPLGVHVPHVHAQDVRPRPAAAGGSGHDAVPGAPCGRG